jgi:hypothetical protein
MLANDFLMSVFPNFFSCRPASRRRFGPVVLVCSISRCTIDQFMQGRLCLCASEFAGLSGSPCSILFLIGLCANRVIRDSAKKMIEMFLLFFTEQRSFDLGYFKIVD